MTGSTWLDATLSDAAIRNGYLDLEARQSGFFPADSLGNCSGDRKGMAVTLEFDGKAVETDIRVKNEITISPRTRFGSWFKSLRAVSGDVIRVHRAGSRRYRLEYLSRGLASGASPPASTSITTPRPAQTHPAASTVDASPRPAHAASAGRPQGTITQGLVVADPWVDLILSGRKTWEIRGESVAKRGPFAILRKGTGTIAGVATLVDSRGPLSLDELRATNHLHAVPVERFAGEYRYDTPYAWVLEGAKRLARPLPYRHPSGAVKWVNLDSSVLGELRRALDSAE